MTIDSHLHFWRYDAAREAWITDEMSVLKRDFLPADLIPELDANGIEACVAVQTDQSEKETLFLLGLAQRYKSIAGVVGWVDLCAPGSPERLRNFSRFEKLRGFRHIVQTEPDDRFMVRAEFVRGIASLAEFQFVYDLLVYPKQLPAAIELVAKFPEQRFVVDHIAKPAVKAGWRGGASSEWARHMRTIAAGANVYCKLYDLAVPVLLLHYFPTGILGLGLTALLASFMSGMAGNVTAFNTVWTYDIYQAYIRKNATDAHYLWMGRMATVFGITASVLAAYVATQFNNIMDVLQLVFAFVNAPLFATFLLGMFWKRATGHGALGGLFSGTLGAALHHGLTLPAGASSGVKGGWMGMLHAYPSEMAQNFWTAIFAWTVCFVVTILVSLLTTPRRDSELVGLVYSLTDRPREETTQWHLRPVTLAMIVLCMTLLLNIVFY